MDETLPPPGRWPSPGILVVEAQSDLVDAARVGHNQVESRLKYLKMHRKNTCYENKGARFTDM